MADFKFFNKNDGYSKIIQYTRYNFCLDMRDDLGIPSDLWLQMLMVSNRVFYFNEPAQRINVCQYGAVEYVRMFYPQNEKKYAHFIITIDGTEMRFKVTTNDELTGFDITLLN